MIGDFLYQIDPKGAQSVALQIEHVYQTKTANNGSVSQDLFTVPDDRILILQAACAFAQPGAIVSSTEVFIGFKHHNLSFSIVDSIVPIDSSVLSIGNRWSANFSGAMVMEPGSIIFATAVFSAANAGNTLTATVFGYSIPRGNMMVG